MLTEERLNGEKHKKNYIYYVSEQDNIPSAGHFIKMDASKEIVNQIKSNIKNCVVCKYSDYSGEQIDAQSVGIIFPTHMWGISWAISIFLNNLNVNSDTYVYVIVAGEKYDNHTLTRRQDRICKLMKQIRDALHKIKSKVDIFIRHMRGDRKFADEYMYNQITDTREKIHAILKSVLFYNEKNITNIENDTELERRMKIKDKVVTYDWIELEHNSLNLDNVFLDDDIFRGVNLCQVI